MVSKIPSELTFTDLLTGKKFKRKRADFTVKIAKNGRRFAQTLSPSGKKANVFF